MPHPPALMPPPLIGLPRIGLPTGLSTVTTVLGFVVPGCQLLFDQMSPFASMAIRPEAYRPVSVYSSASIHCAGGVSRAGW